MLGGGGHKTSKRAPKPLKKTKKIPQNTFFRFTDFLIRENENKRNNKTQAVKRAREVGHTHTLTPQPPFHLKKT